MNSLFNIFWIFVFILSINALNFTDLDGDLVAHKILNYLPIHDTLSNFMLTSTINRKYSKQNAFLSIECIGKIIQNIESFNSSNKHSLTIIRNLYDESADAPWFSLYLPSIISRPNLQSNPELLELFHLKPKIIDQSIGSEFYHLSYCSKILIWTSRAILRTFFHLKNISFFDGVECVTNTLDCVFFKDEARANILLNAKTVTSYVTLHKIIYDYTFDYVSNHNNNNLSISLKDLREKFGFIAWNPLTKLSRHTRLDRTQYYNLIKWYDRIMNVMVAVHHYYRTEFLSKLNVHFVKTWLKLQNKLNGKPVYQHSFNPRNVIVRCLEYLYKTNQTNTLKYILPKIIRLDPENVFHIVHFSFTDHHYVTYLLEILIETDGKYLMKPLRKYSNKSRLHQLIYKLHASEIFEHEPNGFTVWTNDDEYDILVMSIMDLYVLYKRYNLLDDALISEQLFKLIIQYAFFDFSTGKLNKPHTIPMIQILKDSAFKRCINELFSKTPTHFTNNIFKIIHPARARKGVHI